MPGVCEVPEQIIQVIPEPLGYVLVVPLIDL
jgi:hypothetical protein